MTSMETAAAALSHSSRARAHTRVHLQRRPTDCGGGAQAYVDECARLRSAFGGMTQVELLRHVSAYAAPYYQGMLDKASAAACRLRVYARACALTGVWATRACVRAFACVCASAEALTQTVRVPLPEHKGRRRACVGHAHGC
jgi:hypothetical protein